MVIKKKTLIFFLNRGLRGTESQPVLRNLETDVAEIRTLSKTKKKDGKLTT